MNAIRRFERLGRLVAVIGTAVIITTSMMSQRANAQTVLPGTTTGGLVGGITTGAASVVRNTSLALPPFRINPVTGTTNFQAAITVNGLGRVYYVIRPNTIVANAPVMFLLHGRGMTADRMANYTAAGNLTRDYGVWIVLPQAAGSSGEWANDPSQTGQPDDVAFLNALIDDVLKQYPLNARRVYFAGLSSGAFMSELMACQASNRIAAIFSVAASIRSSVRPLCTATRPLPVGLINGTADTVVPYDGIASFLATDPPNLTAAPDTGAFWADRNGCATAPVTMMAIPDTVSDTTTVSLRNWTGCPASSPVQLYTVTNGGHTWPGTPFATYTVGLGATSQDIDATAIAWNFMSPFQSPQ